MRHRIRGVGVCLAVALSLTAIPLAAQESAQEKGPAPKVGAKASGTYRRVPQYFSKVGLSTEQREQIYAVRGKYQSQISALQEQIDDLKAREQADCEALLTGPQKTLLEQERGARAKKTGPAAASKKSN